jgi:ribose transport system substrate-binding protein
MGLKLIPITGENFNAFLKQWCQLKDEGFSSFSTAEVNYMAVISLDLAIKAKAGQPVPHQVVVPLPEITDDNVCDWANDKLPDDWYSIPKIPSPAEIDKLIADALAAEQSGGTPVATPAS